MGWNIGEELVHGLVGGRGLRLVTKLDMSVEVMSYIMRGGNMREINL